MAVYLHGTEITNVFRLLGADENSASFALGWAFERSAHYRRLVAEVVFGETPELDDVIVSLQTHGEDRGYTDVELRSGQQLHAILEAKLSWALPSLDQLNRYVDRLRNEGAKRQRLISVSAADQLYASRRLPSTLGGVGLSHLSWSDLQRLATKAVTLASRREEKLWLRHLIQHLQEFTSMERQSSNTVYMVVLSNQPMVVGQAHTWIDVVEKDSCYFHPVGDGTNSWPPQPPNYIGFRYGGRLRSVHHIDSFEVLQDLSTCNPLWLKTDTAHFVYRLGPPMCPAREMRNGNIYPTGRFECAIDTLLSGAFDTISDALAETKRRLAEVP
jgi:hypothetical protein